MTPFPSYSHIWFFRNVEFSSRLHYCSLSAVRNISNFLDKVEVIPSISHLSLSHSHLSFDLSLSETQGFFLLNIDLSFLVIEPLGWYYSQYLEA